MRNPIAILRDLWWGFEDWRATAQLGRRETASLRHDLAVALDAFAKAKAENARLERYAQVVRHLGLDEEAIAAVDRILGPMTSSPQGVNVAFETDSATSWHQTMMHPPRRLLAGDVWTLTITCSAGCAPGIQQSHIHQVKLKVLP